MQTSRTIVLHCLILLATLAGNLAHAQCGQAPNVCTSMPRVKVSRYVSENDPSPDVVYHCTGIEETINVEDNIFKIVIECQPATADLGRSPGEIKSLPRRSPEEDRSGPAQ